MGENQTQKMKSKRPTKSKAVKVAKPTVVELCGPWLVCARDHSRRRSFLWL